MIKIVEFVKSPIGRKIIVLILAAVAAFTLGPDAAVTVLSLMGI